jgi:hypothetical protein
VGRTDARHRQSTAGQCHAVKAGSVMVLLNKQRCELRAGVKFSDKAFAELEWLAEYCELYSDPGAEGRRAPSFMAPHFRSATTTNQQQALHALVAGVQAVWRASGGEGASGTWYDKADPNRNGPLVRLLGSMFEQVGVKRPPSPRTLRRAIQSINNS